MAMNVLATLACCVFILAGSPDSSWQSIIGAIPKTIVFWILGTVLGCIAVRIVDFTKQLFTRDSMQTWLSLQTDRIAAATRAKNAQQIGPSIQSFLWYILTTENATLQLLNAEENEETQLTHYSPFGWNFVCRGDCVFYQYQLISQNVPENLEYLRQTLNSRIRAALNHLGLYGISANYQGHDKKVYPSVYIDRVHYIESEELITFEVLYVSSIQSENYLKNAYSKDRPKPNVEPVVYNDEI